MSKKSDTAITNLYTSVISWGWPMVLALVITPIMVHGLGTDAYGMRGLIFTITGYFALLDLGLNAAGTKYLAEYNALNNPKLIQELLETTLLTYLITGIVGCIVLYFISPWVVLSFFKIPLSLQSEAILSLRIAGLSFVLSMLIWWASAVPTGLQRFDIFNWISVAFGTVTSLSNLTAVLLGYGLLGVIWATVLSNLLALITYCVAARYLLPNVKIGISFSLDMFKRTALFGMWSVLFRALGVFITQLDRIFIAMWLGSAYVSYLIVPNSIASITQQINGKLMQIVFPMASEFSVLSSKDKLQRLVLRSINLTTIIAIGFGLPLFVLANLLMTYWMGAEFASHTTNFLRLMIVVYVLSTLSAAPSSILPGMGYPKITFQAALISSTFIFPLYYFLIRPFGLIGVGIAGLVATIPVILFYFIILSKKAEIGIGNLFLHILKPLATGLLVGIVAYFMIVPILKNLFEVIAAGVVITFAYGIIIWFIGAFDVSEKEMLKVFIQQKLLPYFESIK